MLEQQLNLSKGQIDKVLKILKMESPAPVTNTKINKISKWYATPVLYKPDREKIENLIQIRKQEQTRMMNYMQNQECLMLFLAKELDDPHPTPCGRCAVCLGKPLLPETYSSELAREAVRFLRRSEIVIEPRKKWPDNTSINGWKGKIQKELIAETGRALSLWRDAGWGEMVKKGKYTDKYFDDALVQGASEMVQRWKPQPFPTWVTCVPSLNHPSLVPNFAERLAQQLGLPFIPNVQKIRPTKLQKQMKNSFQQAHNLEGAFDVSTWAGMDGPVFLVDDMVDSRWTFTVIAAILRQAGSGPVFPLALALNSPRQGE